MLALPGLEKYLSSFKKQWQKPGVDKVSTKSINTFGGSIKEVNGKKNEDIKWDYQGVCWEPWHGLHILWDGKVVPCCWDYDGKYILGDLNKQTLEEIWNGKKMQELRKQCATNNFTIPICVKCTEKIYPEYPLKHIIDYIYQRNQTKKIVKTFKRIYNRLM